MPTKKEIQALASELAGYTVFESPGGKLQVPGPSTFRVVKPDLELVKKFTPDPYDFSDDEHPKCPIRLRHVECLGEVDYDQHRTDPILSTWACSGYKDSKSLAGDPYGYSRRGYCGKSWKVVDINQMSLDHLQLEFYIEMLEEPEDMLAWPEKLGEATNGNVRYSCLRPMTTQEFLEGRARRLLEIREKHR